MDRAGEATCPGMVSTAPPDRAASIGPQLFQLAHDDLVARELLECAGHFAAALEGHAQFMAQAATVAQNHVAMLDVKIPLVKAAVPFGHTHVSEVPEVNVALGFDH